MKKYQYFLRQNIRVADDLGVYSGIITAIDNGLYKVEYDYVITAIDIGRIAAISDYDFYKVSYGCNKSRYYNEYEMKPSLWDRLLQKVVAIL